jgi:hypothetical protein
MPRRSAKPADIHDRMPVILAPGDYAPGLATIPTRDAAFPGQPDAHVADFAAGQPARERRPLDCQADRTGNGGCVDKRAAATRGHAAQLSVSPCEASWISLGRPCRRPPSSAHLFFAGPFRYPLV